MLFYQIRSARSLVDKEGLQKMCFSAETEAGTFLFLWLNSFGELSYLQLIFEEQVLSWKPERGFQFAHTNRGLASSGVGRQKGSRTLVPVEGPEGLATGVKRLAQVVLPEEYQTLLNGPLGI